jgi:hypothetical protein
MGSLFSSFFGLPPWQIALLVTCVYIFGVLVMRRFIRPAIVNSYDPLNINFVGLTIPAILGFCSTPFFSDYFSRSFWVILLYLGTWLLIMRLVGKPRLIDMRDRLEVDFQVILLVLAIVVIICNILFNMIIPGQIPLFTEGGVNSRFESTENNRLLTWLSFGTTPIAGVMFAVTQSKRVKRLSVCAVALYIIQNLLFASKAGILTIVFVLLNAMFVAQARRDSQKIRSLRKILIYTVIVVSLLAPVYLVAIGLQGDSQGLITLGTRFMGGFDQLIIASQSDLLAKTDFGSVLKTNIFEYQLMPFFKAISGNTYDYSSIGQYVIEAFTGRKIEGAYTFPNSNLILETVLTSGNYVGYLVFIVELTIFYVLRYIALRSAITPFSLVLLLGTVFSPIGLFYSGQEWMTEIVLIAFTIALALGIANLWRLALSVLRLCSIKKTALADGDH